jgi:hypothetical protein
VDRTFPLHRSARNSSGYTSVYPHGKNGWRAAIKDGPKLRHIGSYPTPELAAEAYAIARARHTAKSLKRRKRVAASKNKRALVAILRLLKRLARANAELVGPSRADELTFPPGRVETVLRSVSK